MDLRSQVKAYQLYTTNQDRGSTIVLYITVLNQNRILREMWRTLRQCFLFSWIF